MQTGDYAHNPPEDCETRRVLRSYCPGLLPCLADATTDARISRAPPHPPNAPESVPLRLRRLPPDLPSRLRGSCVLGLVAHVEDDTELIELLLWPLLCAGDLTRAAPDPGECTRLKDRLREVLRVGH
jgi:hypothetical protein